MDIIKVTPVPQAQGKKSKKVRWQAYVDDALMRTGQVTQAAIYGLDGMQWAASRNFQVCNNSTIIILCSSGLPIRH
jgi:profilin